MEGVGHGRPTLDEQLDDVAPTELVEHAAEVPATLEAGVDAGAGRRTAEHDAQRIASGDMADRERGSSARTVPAPTSTASLSARSRWTSALASSPVIHWLVPSGGGGAPVDGGGELEHDVRPARAAVREVGRQLRLDGLGLDADGDVDPCRPQGGDAPSGDLRIGILDADDDAADAGLDDGVDARRRAAGVAARLERA